MVPTKGAHQGQARFRLGLSAITEEVAGDACEWIAQALQEHDEAKARHQRFIVAHETIIHVLRACEQQAMTAAQAIAQLEEVAASEVDLDLVGLYRQTMERLRK